MSTITVLYEDNHLIAVFKPAGILSQGDATGDVSIFDEVKKYLKLRYKKPGAVFLGLLHRLDRPVSGIILFARTSKGASRLSKQFRDRTIEKIYYAIVIGRLQADSRTLINHIEKTKNQKSKIKITNQNSKVAEAILHYETIKSNTRYSLLKIKLETGKFHQIRAQLSAAGHPILGDVKYGGEKWGNEKTIALCATNLSFKTAIGDKTINLSIDLPDEWQSYLSTQGA